MSCPLLRFLATTTKYPVDFERFSKSGLQPHFLPPLKRIYRCAQRALLPPPQAAACSAHAQPRDCLAGIVRKWCFTRIEK
jgi:hypothetical protein